MSFALADASVAGVTLRDEPSRNVIRHRRVGETHELNVMGGAE